MNKLLISKVSEYRIISKLNYYKYKEFNRKIDEVCELPDEECDSIIGELIDQLYFHRTIAIVFQAMAVEAFINEYIYLRLGKSYFESLEKLSPLEKIFISCKMITGKDFPKGCYANELVNLTIKQRNGLVHFKAKEVEIGNNNVKSISDREFDKIMDTYDTLVKELVALDEKFDPKYLREIPEESWYSGY